MVLVTSPARCSFDIYINGNGLWGPADDDEWLDLLTKKATSYIYERMLFDTPKGRQTNKLFFNHNPYLASEGGDDDDRYKGMYDDDDDEDITTTTTTTTGGSVDLVVHNLKRTLTDMGPYVTFLDRIHKDVMENETTTHQAFQKSVFYEVCFFQCLYKTSEDLLTAMILGCNDVYLGFPLASVGRMREKYTGKQYMSIIPRGLGKTTCIKLTTAVALVTFRGVEILAMAHTKTLICSTKDDIESTLNACFPAPVYGYFLQKHEDSLILVFKDGVSSRLKYASACRPATLRGNDPSIGFLDEALCVSEDSYSVINAMIQRKHTKIGFLSSPISSKKDALLNLVVNMATKCATINLYRLCYFCLDRLHVQYSSSHTGCYRKMFAPRYIVYDDANKSFEGVITRSEASYENELGVIRPEDIAQGQYDSGNDDATRAVFNKQFLDHLRDPMTHVKLADLPCEDDHASYWIYMDPAYHPSEQSAIAIMCLRLVRGKRAVLCFADRKLLSHGDLGRVSAIMEEMYTKCVTTVVEHSGGLKCYFYVAIERNSNPDAVRSYYSTWVDLRGKGVVTSRQCDFFNYVDVYAGRKLSYGYNLGARKKHIFSTVANFLNTKHSTHFKVASTTEFGAYTKDVCTLEHVVSEIKHFYYKDRKYTGKRNKTSTDDAITCLVMALYLALAHEPSSYTRIQNLRNERVSHCTPPWIGSNCSCPLNVS
jgi:hypothetical protein